jgi:hypothetical protein
MFRRHALLPLLAAAHTYMAPGYQHATLAPSPKGTPKCTWGEGGEIVPRQHKLLRPMFRHKILAADALTIDSHTKYNSHERGMHAAARRLRVTAAPTQKDP